MLSPWLLLPLLFTLSWAFSGSRHPEGRLESSEGPTCEQLRAFWEIINRTTKMGQITNEIPILPLEAYSTLDHLTTGLRRKEHHIRPFGKNAQDMFSNQIDIAYPFSEQLFKMQHLNQPDRISPLQPEPFVPLQPEPVLLQPESLVILQPEPPSDQDLNGIFGEFHEQVPSMPMISNQPRTEPEMFGFGSSVVPLNSKNDESDSYIPQWGSPEEVDTFGSFVDFDIGHRAMTRTPKDAVGELPDLSQRITSRRKSSQAACDILVNTDCNISEQCSCRGSKKLICVHGKCLEHEPNSDVGEQHEIWHDGPIPQSQLRLLTRLRKRSKKTIFM